MYNQKSGDLMFLDHINTDLFRPLVSKNSHLYSIGIWAIYESLTNHYIEGECTTKQARQVIHNALSSKNQNLTWIQEEDEEILDQTNMAIQIYSVLKKTGWIVEMDDVGYRRIVYIPQQSSRLLQAIKSVSDKRSYSIEATFQGIYGALLLVQNKPLEYCAQVTFAAKVTRDLNDEIKAIAASVREVTHKMREQSISTNLFQTFFDEFLIECLGGFDRIKIKSHPNRYRNDTIEIVTKLLDDDEKLDQISKQVCKENNHSNYEIQKQQIKDDLYEIIKIFNNIPRLMDIIEQYRGMTLQRTRDAMTYSFEAVPEIGRKIETIIKKLSKSQLDTSNLLPSPVIHEEYVASCRLSNQRKPKPDAQPIKQQKKNINKWDIAYSRVYDDYLARRTPQPERLEKYILKALGDKASVTTCDMSINCLDDLLAFLQLRELLYNSVPIDSPFEQLSKTFKVTPVVGVITDNKYITAPSLKIERF